jgi:hypothetical protein
MTVGKTDDHHDATPSAHNERGACVARRKNALRVQRATAWIFKQENSHAWSNRNGNQGLSPVGTNELCASCHGHVDANKQNKALLNFRWVIQQLG